MVLIIPQEIEEELIRYGYKRIKNYEPTERQKCYVKEQLVGEWMHEWRFCMADGEFTWLFINATRIKKEEKTNKYVDQTDEKIGILGHEPLLSKASKDNKFCLQELNDKNIIKYLNEIRKLEEGN